MSTKPAERVSDSGIHGEPAGNGVAHGPVLSEERLHALAQLPALGAPAQAKSHVWQWLLVLVLAGGGWYTRDIWMPWISLGRSGSGSAKKPERIIPVKTAIVQSRDWPDFINGLGTVTAFKTVTLKSRVDGELIKVAFTEGQTVSEGDVLAQIDPRPFETQLEQAEGMLSKDEATLELARLNLIRVKELKKSNSIAQQQVDEQVAMVQQLEGTVQTDRGLVANARLQLSYCRIIAPVSGRIGLRLVDQGNIVHANDVMGMAVITQLQPIALVIPVPQDEIPRVQKRISEGEDVQVFAFDRKFTTKLATGKLYAIDNQVDVTSGTFKLKAVFDNEDGMLFPNQFVNAKVQIDTIHDAVVIPTAAVQSGPKGKFVYVAKPDDTVELRNIISDKSEGDETLIVTGLAPGETVVTDGIDKLTKDSKITTQDKEKAKEVEREKVKDHADNAKPGAESEEASRREKK